MENSIINLINENGRFFVSRRSVESPYRLGLNFTNLSEGDIKTINELGDMFGGKITVKKLKKSYAARIISNRFITKLINGNETINDIFSDECLKNKNLCETINLLTEDEETDVFVVDEDLPF